MTALQFITIVQEDGSTHNIHLGQGGATIHNTQDTAQKKQPRAEIDCRYGTKKKNVLRRVDANIMKPSCAARATRKPIANKRIAHVIKMFQEMDVEGKGYLVEEDQIRQYREQGANIDEPKINAYRIAQWKKIDCQGSGRISLHEYGMGYGLEPAHFMKYEAAQAGGSSMIGQIWQDPGIGATS
jgi:hypothetical protein